MEYEEKFILGLILITVVLVAGYSALYYHRYTSECNYYKPGENWTFYEKHFDNSYDDKATLCCYHFGRDNKKLRTYENFYHSVVIIKPYDASKSVCTLFELQNAKGNCTKHHKFVWDEVDNMGISKKCVH